VFFLGGRGEKRVEIFFSLQKVVSWVTWGGGKFGCFGRMGLRKDLSKYAKLLRR
jgi:hypothetical protein